MRFEKINENKIRIFLSGTDLLKNNIDFHAFMSNPIESQSLFLRMLNKAEKEIGFNTKNYDVKIEAMQIASEIFILTITRVLPEKSKKADINKRVHIRKSNINYDIQNSIYVFNTFDDFCLFSSFIKKHNIKANNIAKKVVLFEYKNNYYLLFSEINLKNNDLNKILVNINEFATHLICSELFRYKILDTGQIIMKNNAIETAIKYF